ncbi:hypothetical protein GLOIN_2v1781474 [Rhizophagus clarus]|uniref:Bromo domain-containing protein n=1 Tax=Rhizophagus clarus TaxID=94130 RepID=A0A8H3L4T9_9GLOM|nr:hypothetical protein GLOIN_2v1781474 [Rhizophagus clarus]
MSATTNNYIGYKALVSYLSEQRNWSYRGFLDYSQDTIVNSLISDSSLTLAKWQSIDAAWYNRFFDNAKELLEPNTFITIITEHLQRKKELQIFWQKVIKECEEKNQKCKKNQETTTKEYENKNQEIIKKHKKKEKENQVEEYEKENLMPVVTSFPKKTSKDQSAMITTVTSLSKEIIEQNLTVASLPKKTVKTSVENFSNTLQSNKLINFCYDIFHKLENNPYAYLFYKYNEKDIIDKAIKHPMDLFTVNSKLENDQYTNLEEFENDIRLIFRNCYTYNDAKSEVYCSGEALESVFNKKWNEKLIFQTRRKGELKRVRDNDADTNNSFTKFQKKQNQILEEYENNVNHHIINDTLPIIASAYENLVIDNIMPFIEILKTFLSTRSRMSLSSANESMLQAIVESLLPLKYRIPELSLVMDGKKPKGSGRFGYLDIFILKGTGDNYISLELKYISLVGLIRNQNTKFGANELENLDKILEKENEEFLLKRPYTYWSKEHKTTNQTTIGEVLNNGIDQLESYINIISKGKAVDYSSSGVYDERIKITKSDSNILKGYVILVIGFRRILWRPVEEVISNYTYIKV